jgi:hypothetical protein
MLVAGELVTIYVSKIPFFDPELEGTERGL